MITQDNTYTTLLEFADALKQDYTFHADYEVDIKRNILTVVADFYTHMHKYSIRLTKMQANEVKKNMVHWKDSPGPNQVVEADDDIITLFAMSLRKELIDGVLLTL